MATGFFLEHPDLFFLTIIETGIKDRTAGVLLKLGCLVEHSGMQTRDTQKPVQNSNSDPSEDAAKLKILP